MRTSRSSRRWGIWSVHSTRWLAGLCVGALCAGARPGWAQERPSPELTQALVRAMFPVGPGDALGAAPELLVGRVPPDLAPELPLPQGTRVLASVRHGWGVTVLATAAAAPDSLREALTRALTARGWAPAAEDGPGGLRPAPTLLPLALCRGDTAEVRAMIALRPGAPTDLRLDYRAGERSACGRRFDRPFGRRGPPEADEMPQMPTLYAPPVPAGAAPGACAPGERGGWGGWGGQMSTGMDVPTDLSAEALLRHYARQLEGAGWAGTPNGTGAAVGTWIRRDASGVAARATLSITDAPDGAPCRNVQLTMTRAPGGR